jgi:leucyl/phenylalanyl-tRNA--protein transferase
MSNRHSPRLTPELLLAAYRKGLFPMADARDSAEIGWYFPPLRAVIPLDDQFHIPRSLQQWMRNSSLRCTRNQAFECVISACAEPTPDRPDSWINPAIVAAYTALHQRGHAHSVEVWEGEMLVGGLYGVHIGAAFFGESMFSRRPNASKLALVHLVEHLRRQGFLLLDSQIANAHMQQFGLQEIPAYAYLQRLEEALAHAAIF